MAKSREARLNDIITANLWAPSGDPDDNNLFAAAEAYKLLKEDGLTVKAEQEVINQLRRDNVYESDFLKDMPDALPTTDPEE